MKGLFRCKPIADLLDIDDHHSLRRTLGASDLILLSIGAVIGAGIFGAIGTAAAGEVNAAGEVVRHAAGPALVVSFVLLGAACALAGLCYAELASMIPHAGSAYSYCYATLGEFVAWIIGWDLILEYAVGNVAVAISWGDYFTALARSGGIALPEFLTTGYRTALLSSRPEVRALLDTAPQVAGIPILINLPAFVIVSVVTWLLMRGVRESARANAVMVFIKLLALTLFIGVGLMHIDGANYRPFAPNGFTGIHQGAAIVFFAYIGFDAISVAAEETRDPQRNMPIGILGGLALCTLIYVIVGAVLTGMVPYTELGVADPLARALELAGYRAAGRTRCARRRGVHDCRAARVPVRPATNPHGHGTRRVAAVMGRANPSDTTDSSYHDNVDRAFRGTVGSGWGRGRNVQSDEHRNALRVRAREHWWYWCCGTPIRRDRARFACRLPRLCVSPRRPPVCSSCRVCPGRHGGALESG